MKKKEQIYIFNGKNLELSESSILHPSTIERLNFSPIVIGDYERGFSPYNLQQNNYENIILNAHGINVQSYLLIETNVLTDFNTFLSELLSANTNNKPIVLIITSCYGKNAHNRIELCSKKLPVGSKIITFADFAQSHFQDNEMVSSNKLNAEINFFEKNNLKFFDLLLLYCLNKSYTYEVPTIGVQTEKGYKFLSLDQILTIPQSIELNVVDNLSILFENSVISNDKMIFCINGFNSDKSNERGAVNIFEIIKSNTALKSIVEILEKVWYFGGDLKNIDISEPKSNEFLEYGARVERISVLLKQNNIVDPELMLNLGKIKEITGVNKDTPRIDEIYKENVDIAHQNVNGSIQIPKNVTLTEFLISCYDLSSKKLINQEKLNFALELLMLLGIDDELQTDNLYNLYDSLLEGNSLLRSYKSALKISCNVSQPETLITHLMDEPPLTKNDYLHIVAANLLCQSKNVEKEFFSTFIGDDNLASFEILN